MTSSVPPVSQRKAKSLQAQRSKGHTAGRGAKDAALVDAERELRPALERRTDASLDAHVQAVPDVARSAHLDSERAGSTHVQPPAPSTTLARSRFARHPHSVKNIHHQAAPEASPPSPAGLLIGEGGVVSEKLEEQPAGKTTQTVGIWTTIVETYRDRPIAFVEDLLVRNYPGFEVQGWQKTFLKAVGRGERKISV